MNCAGLPCPAAHGSLTNMSKSCSIKHRTQSIYHVLRHTQNCSIARCLLNTIFRTPHRTSSSADSADMKSQIRAASKVDLRPGWISRSRKAILSSRVNRGSLYAVIHSCNDPNRFTMLSALAALTPGMHCSMARHASWRRTPAEGLTVAPDSSVVERTVMERRKLGGAGMSLALVQESSMVGSGRVSQWEKRSGGGQHKAGSTVGGAAVSHKSG